MPAAFRRRACRHRFSSGASLNQMSEENQRVWGQFQIPPGRYEAMDDPATPSSFSRIYPTLLIEPQRSKEWLLTAIPLRPGKEDVPDNLLFRSPRFRVRRYSNSSRAQSTDLPMVLRLNINQPGPEALNQIISKRGCAAHSTPGQLRDCESALSGLFWPTPWFGSGRGFKA